jgi:hypothetical protein
MKGHLFPANIKGWLVQWRVNGARVRCWRNPGRQSWDSEQPLRMAHWDIVGQRGIFTPLTTAPFVALVPYTSINIEQLRHHRTPGSPQQRWPCTTKKTRVVLEAQKRLRNVHRPGMVAHICNPSFWGGRYLEDQGLTPAGQR